MTVNELIKVLESFDGDLEVVYAANFFTPRGDFIVENMDIVKAELYDKKVILDEIPF